MKNTLLKTAIIKNFIVLLLVTIMTISFVDIASQAATPSFGALDKSIFSSIPFALPASPTLAGTKVECEVIINGGSMSALFAGIGAAKEGANTCLLEPTDWVGGQLTASGVSAIDWQWMSNSQGVDVKAAHSLRDNATFLFWDWMKAIGNPGKCTVSRNCFMPLDLLDKYIKPYLQTIPNLKIYYNTVVKSVDKAKIGTSYDTYLAKDADVNQIRFVNAITRIPNPSLAYKGYDKRLSEDLPDWYSTSNSARFTKQIVNFTGLAGTIPVVIDASEFGDVMVLSGAEYMQGSQLFDGSKASLNDQCGQGITHTFNMKYNATATAENGPALGTFPRTTGVFNSAPYGWDGVWRYRRLLGGNTPGQISKALPGEITVMNWRSMDPNNGNDYGAKYPFKSYSDAAAEKADWKGGMNLATLKGAEDLSYDFYYWFKEQSPTNNGNQFTLDNDSMQTSTGLYKVPYFRDIRRSVGIDNFMLKTTDEDAQNPTGYRFADRVAITSYPFDIHPTENCVFSNDDQGLNDVLGKKEEPTAIFIPFRSLTNRTTANMLVAGKAISQTLKAGAGTRLQPGEAETGTAAGVSAAYMSKNKIKNVYDMVLGKNAKTYTQNITAIQTNIKKYQNINWTVAGKVYPSATEKLPTVRFMYLCPTGTIVDQAEGFCNYKDDSYTSLTTAMTTACTALGLGTACTISSSIPANAMTVKVSKIPKKTARSLRKTADCPDGSVKDSILTDFCVQGQGPNKEIFGPFTYSDVKACLTIPKGGNACYATKYNYNFAKSWIGK
jgi:FAD dependent oxidoreductase